MLLQTTMGLKALGGSTTNSSDAATDTLHFAEMVSTTYTSPVSTSPVSTSPIFTSPISTSPISTSPISRVILVDLVQGQLSYQIL